MSTESEKITKLPDESGIKITKLPDESDNKKQKDPKRVAGGKRFAQYHKKAKPAMANNNSQNNDNNDNSNWSLNNVTS